MQFVIYKLMLAIVINGGLSGECFLGRNCSAGGLPVGKCLRVDYYTRTWMNMNSILTQKAC